MPRLYVTVSALALLGSPAAIASAAPIIVGTVPPPASSAATTPAATTAETKAAAPAAPATPAPEAKPVAAAPAAAPAPPAAGAPVAPDMKNFPNTMDFLAANRTFRAQVAMAWAKGQIDAPTFRSLMATYRSNVQAGKVASAK